MSVRLRRPSSWVPVLCLALASCGSQSGGASRGSTPADAALMRYERTLQRVCLKVKADGDAYVRAGRLPLREANVPKIRRIVLRFYAAVSQDYRALAAAEAPPRYAGYQAKIVHDAAKLDPPLRRIIERTRAARSIQDLRSTARSFAKVIDPSDAGGEDPPELLRAAPACKVLRGDSA